MASSIHPLADLYNSLNSALGEEDEEKLRNLLRDRQIPVRDLQSLRNPAQIFNYLERHGFIDKDNLQLLKDLLTKIQRMPLIKLVNECEEILKTHFEIPESKRPRLSGYHYAGPSGCGAVDRKDRNRMHDEIPDVVNLCQKSLQETYNNYSHITPFPWWDGTERLKLEDVYTELELQTKDGKKTYIAKTDIFSPRDDCGTPRRILIEGDPGYGKTTFCKKLAFDWASKESGYLNRFKLLFLLELKDLYEYEIENTDKHCLIDVISDLLLDFCDQDKNDLWNYIKSNQSEVCILFDGLDEVQTKDLPFYFQEIVQQKSTKLKNSVVVVTSRKIREKNEKQYYDTQLCIKGFDDKTFKEFVKKHFKATHTNEVHDESFVMESFLRKLDDLADKDVLSDLSKSPLMALMVCDIAIENETLPETVTKLYTCIVDIVVKRYLAKGNYSEEAADKMKTDIVKTLSEIAYESSGKVKDKHQHVLKVGFLTTASRPLSSGSLRYKFVHKTFQEYFAARYLSDLPPDETDILRQLIDQCSRIKSFTVITFLAGILGDNVSKLFRNVPNIKYRSFYNSDCDMLLDLLIESCSDSAESIEALAAVMPKVVKLNLDSISKYNQETEIIEKVIRRLIHSCISFHQSDTVIFQISQISENSIQMFGRMSKSLAADDFKLNQVLFVIETRFESEFHWQSLNLHYIRELQVFETTLELSDIVSKVRILHRYKLLNVVVLRSRFNYPYILQVFVRKRDNGPSTESSDGIHVCLESPDLRGGQSCTEMAADLKSVKSITYDEMALKVDLKDCVTWKRDITFIVECIQSVNVKLMSIRFLPPFGLILNMVSYPKFNNTSLLKPLHPSTKESTMDKKLQLCIELFYSFKVSFSTLLETLSFLGHIGLERFYLICGKPFFDDESENTTSKMFNDVLDSLSHFQAREVFFYFPLFRFDLMETVCNTIQRNSNSPLLDVTFFEKLEYVRGNDNLITFKINMQHRKHAFHFISNKNTVDVESLTQAVSDLVISRNDRFAIEFLHKFHSQNYGWHCDLMGMTLSLPSLDSKLITKFVSIHNQLNGNVRRDLYGNVKVDDSFDKFCQCAKVARNVCLKSRQCEIIELIEQELASDTSFVQRLKLSRHEMCVIGKSQNPIITQANENEDGLMLSCRFNYSGDYLGGYNEFGFNSSFERFSDSVTSEKIHEWCTPLDEIYSDLCRACEDNPQTQSLCLTFSEKDSAEKSLTEQIVNIVNGLRCLRKLDIVNGDFTSGTDDDELWVQLLKNGSLSEIAFHKCNLHNKINTLTCTIREIDRDRQSKLKVTLCDSLEIGNVTKVRDKLCESHFKVSSVDNLCLEGANISVNIENVHIRCSHEM